VAVAPVNGVTQPSLHTETIYLQGSLSDNSRATVRAALYAGVAGAVLSSIPIGPSFWFAQPIAGFLVVLFYRRWTHGPEPQPAFGFKLGALAGLFGFPVFLVLTAILTASFHGEAIMRQAMIDAVHLQQARATEPQIRQMLDYFLTPPGMMLMLAFGFLIMGIVFVLLSGAGAALSASLLRRKDSR
jgi:hypothetical protein